MIRFLLIYTLNFIFFIFLILLTNTNSNIIPNSHHPLYIKHPTFALPNQKLTINFKFSNKSPGLAYRQYLAIEFPIDIVNNIDFTKDDTYSCELLESINNNYLDVSAIKPVFSPVNNEKLAESNIAYCRLEEERLNLNTEYSLSIIIFKPININKPILKIDFFTSTDNNSEKIKIENVQVLGSVGLYSNYKNYTGYKAINIQSISTIITSGPSVITGSSVLYTNNSFDISFKLLSDVNINKQDFIVVLRYNSNVFTGPTTVESLPIIIGNPLKDSLNGNLSILKLEDPYNILEENLNIEAIQIEGINEDFVPNREFILKLNNWTTNEFDVNIQTKFMLYVYYKNTYSVASYSEINAPIVNFTDIKGSANHPEYFKLFDGMGWPMKFSFTVNNNINKEVFIVIRQSNTRDIETSSTLTPPTRWTFVAASCDFSENSDIDNSFGKRPTCFPLRNDFAYVDDKNKNLLGSSVSYEGDGIAFKLINGLKTNSTYNLLVWGFAEICGYTTNNTLTNDNSYKSKFEFSIKAYFDIKRNIKDEVRFVNKSYLIANNKSIIRVPQYCYHSAAYGSTGFETNKINSTLDTTLYTLETTDFWTYSATATPNTNVYPDPPTSILQYFGSKYAHQTQEQSKLVENINIDEKFLYSSSNLELVGNSYVAIGKYTRTSDSVASNFLANYMPTDCVGVTSTSNTSSRWEFIFSKQWFVEGNAYNDSRKGCLVSITHEYDFSSNIVCTTKNCFQRPYYKSDDDGLVPYIHSYLNIPNLTDTIDRSRTNIPPIASLDNTGPESIYKISSIVDKSAGGVREMFAVLPSCDTQTVSGTVNVDINYFETLIFTDCLKWNSNMPQLKSIYTYLDIQWHNIKQYGLASVDTDPITRVWRYIKLFPEPGLFQDFKNLGYITNKKLVIGHYSLTFWGKSTYAVCIIEINGDALSESFVNDDSNVLVIWLFATSLLDVDYDNISAEYPIAPKSSNIIAYGYNSGQTISSYNKLSSNNSSSSLTSPNTILEKEWFGTVGNYYNSTKTTAPYDTRKTKYQFYLGSVIYITFKKQPYESKITTDDNSITIDRPPLFIPFYCPQFNDINSDRGKNGVVFAHPVVIINWLNMNSFTKINRVSKILMDGTKNSMTKYADTPNSSVYNNSNTYYRTAIGLYKGGSNTIENDNYTSNKYATSINDNLNYATLRFESYYPEYNSDEKLYIYSGTKVAVNTRTINCSGASFLLNSEIDYNSETLSTQGFSNMRLYGSTINSVYYVNGKIFNKIVLGSIPPSYNSGPPVVYNSATPVRIINLSSTTIPLSSSYVINGIKRPLITTFSKNNTISTADKIGFFCSNNLRIEDPNTAKDNITILSNYIYSSIESDNSLKHFLLDITLTISPWFNVVINSDADPVYRADSAGNIKTSFKLPTIIPAGSELNFVGDSFFVNIETICGIEETKGGVVTECYSKTTTNITCKTTKSSQEFNVCCYNVKYATDDVKFSTAYVTLPHMPDINLASDYLNNELYRVNTSIVSPFVFKTYQSNAIDVNTSKSSFISDLKYDYTNQDSAIGIATFYITLSRNITRNMEIKIQGDISSLLVPGNSPRCLAIFGNNNSMDFNTNWENGNIVNKLCSVSKITSSNNPVVVRTKKLIYKCGLQMSDKLIIRLWPVIQTNWLIEPFRSYKYRVITRLVTSGSPLSSTSTEFVMPFFDESINQKPLIIGKWEVLCPIIEIFPKFSGFNANYIFEFDILSYKAEIESSQNDIKPNEFSIYFPFNLFGDLSNKENNKTKLNCYYKDKLLNCDFSYPSILNIRMSSIPIEKVKIKITGIKNPNYLYQASIPCSINSTNYSTNNRITLITGSGKYNDYLLNKAISINGGLIYLNNESYPSNTIPRYYSNHYFKFTIDYANRLTNDFSSPDEPIIMIEFPEEYNLPWYVERKIESTIFEYRTNFGSSKEVEPIITRKVEVDKTEVNGNRVDIYYKKGTSSNSDYTLDSFLYFEVMLINIPNPINETKDNSTLKNSITTDLFNITFIDLTHYVLLKTYTNLNNKVSNLLLFPINNYLKYSKGYEFQYPSWLWVVDVIDSKNNLTNEIIIYSGRYNKYNFKVKKNNSVLLFLKNTFISLDNRKSAYLLNDIFKLKKEEYEIQTSFFGDIPFEIGCSCDSIPGSYLIKFKSTNDKIFSPLPIIRTTLNTKEKAQISYLPPPVVPVSGSCFIYYSLSETNFDILNIIWKDSEFSANDATALIKPSNIKPYFNGKNYSEFIITARNGGIQVFKAENPNSCFIWKEDTIEIKVEGVMANIPNSVFTLENFTYYNSNNDSNISKNSIKFEFSSEYTNIYLFCVLVCYSLNYPSDSDIIKPSNIPENQMLPDHLNNFNLQYVYNNTVTDILFNNLARGKRYKLKCIIQSSQGDISLRTKSVITTDIAKSTNYDLFDDSMINSNLFSNVYNNISSTYFIPTISHPSRCARYTFDSDPGYLVKESMLNRLIKLYSEPLGYENNGCIIATDIFGNTVNGLNFLSSNYTCGFNEYKFHPPTAENDPLLISVGKIEKYGVCAVPHPVCSSDVQNNKFNEIFETYVSQLREPEDFVKTLNITGIRSFEFYDIRDVNPPQTEGLEVTNIVENNGIFRFNVTNPIPIVCYFTISSNSTKPLSHEIEDCYEVKKETNCGILRIDKYGNGATVNYGPITKTNSFYLYTACYNDVPFPKNRADTKIIKSYLVTVKEIPDISFNITDPLNVTSYASYIYFCIYICHIMILFLYL